MLLAGFPNPVRLSLEVELHDGGAEARDLRCTLHAVRDEQGDGCRRIRLRPGERLDRDFILRFRLGDATIQSTLTLHPDALEPGAGTFALTIVPPLESPGGNTRPRAVAFVLDRSGSMAGWKIVAARRAMARMIDTLNDSDQFCVLAFDSVLETPPGHADGLVVATDRNRFRAVEYLAGLGARGGTEMAGPLDRAVKLLAKVSPEERDRVLVLVTDGQVGNEDQILATLGRNLKGIRVFTLGIDQAVNEAFLRRLSERGGGACELVESEQRLDDVMQSVHRRIGAPLLTGLFLEGEGIAIEPGEVVPRRLPDLFSGSPLLILGRYRGRPEGRLAMRATDTAGRAWSEAVLGTVRDNPAIASAWARGQIRQIEDRYATGDGDRTALEHAIVALSLKFHVLCRFTAYVAIDRSQPVNQRGSLHQITQPVEMPAGWEVTNLIGRATRASFVQNRHSAARRDVRREASSIDRAAPRLVLGSHEQVGALDQGALACRSEARPSAPLDAGAFDSSSNMTHSGGPPPLGALPDRFEGGEVVAEGAMGRIYKALDRDRGHEVLVKVTVRGQFSPEMLERWQRQNEALKRLAHPALPPALEIGSSGDSFWVALPIFKGQTLAERLRTAGPMPFREAAMLVAAVAEAVHLAREQALVLGDLNPEHVHLGDDGQTRLLGFEELPLRSRDFVPGRFFGTPAYMAPEQVRGASEIHDPPIQVYALGVLLYEILAGQPPFSGSALQILAKGLHEKPTPPRKIVGSIPAALQSICLKAMARDAGDRYPTSGELAAALRKFLTPGRRKGFWKSS